MSPQRECHRSILNAWQLRTWFIAAVIVHAVQWQCQGFVFRNGIPRTIMQRPSALSFFATTTPLSDDDNLRQSFMKDSGPQQKILLSWALEDADDSMDFTVSIGPSKLMMVASKKSAGNGLFVNQSIKKGDILMVIPSEKVICVEDAWEDDLLGKDFMYLTDEGGPGAKLATLAGFVAKEAILGGIETLFQPDDESIHSNSSSSGTWQPYFDCLPWTDDHVLWWSDDDIDRLLKGSNIYEEVVTMRTEVDIAIENIQNIFLHYHSSDDDSLQGQEVNDVVLQKIATSVRCAFCMLLSRAFEDDDFDCMKLIPVLDMTQHSAERVNILHATDPTTGNVIVRAKRDLKKGEEVFNCYSTTLTPAQYLIVFGFVPNDKGLTARRLLEDKNSIFFSTTTTTNDNKK